VFLEGERGKVWFQTGLTFRTGKNTKGRISGEFLASYGEAGVVHRLGGRGLRWRRKGNTDERTSSGIREKREDRLGRKKPYIKVYGLKTPGTPKIPEKGDNGGAGKRPNTLEGEKMSRYSDLGGQGKI